MSFRSIGVFTMIAILAGFQLGMGRHGQYDEEARLEQKIAKEEKGFQNPATGIASGVKEAAFDTTTGLLSETREGARTEGPIAGTLEGVTRGSGKVLDGAVKGAVKVATLGQGELTSYEVTPPASNAVSETLYSPGSNSDSADSDVTKITIKIPGT